MTEHRCRACRGQAGQLVLDLGEQPACDFFPKWDDPGPDPVYPLQMWLCSSCGLAQLLTDPTVPEEPRGTEPAALVAQAEDAVRSLVPVTGDGEADVILDCFGMMHAADQAAAIAERTARLARGGVLLLQYHSLDTIVRGGQWNALRHGHYAYYSTTALTSMLAAVGFSPRTSWQFDLYGGTILLAARRDTGDQGGPDESVSALLGTEAGTGVRDPRIISGLQRDASARADGLRNWLEAARDSGKDVLAYSAASRAIALLCKAGVHRDLLPAVADASPAKHGLRMPGTDIPVISPAELTAREPDAVVLFVPDLMPEVRKAYPEIEAAGGSWIDADSLL
jgi:hypothetical protein